MGLMHEFEDPSHCAIGVTMAKMAPSFSPSSSPSCGASREKQGWNTSGQFHISTHLHPLLISSSSSWYSYTYTHIYIHTYIHTYTSNIVISIMCIQFIQVTIFKTLCLFLPVLIWFECISKLFEWTNLHLNMKSLLIFFFRASRIPSEDGKRSKI